MDLISQRLVTLREAFTLRRVFAISILIAVVHAALSAVKWIANGENLFGAPPWAYALFAGAVVAFSLLFELANRLRVHLEPKFEVTFHPTEEGLAKTPTEIPVVEGGLVKRIPDEAVYLRITVNCLTEATIKDCVAFITKIEKRPPKVEQFYKIPLQGVIPLLPAPRAVYANIPATMDFVKSGKHDNKFDCFIATDPFYLRRMFDDLGTYRFTIRVNGDGNTKEIQIDVKWDGQWDTISARQV